MKKIVLIFLSSCALTAQAQNLFPVKVENCTTDRFCLDCGEIKAGYEEKEFAKMMDKLNQQLNLKGLSGGVKFQVLVDAKGRACVLSHTDPSNNPITLQIINELNSFKNWTAASTQGKKEEKSSINLLVSISEGKLTGKIERVDMAAFKQSFDKPKSPEIFNTNYHYTNANLNKYEFTVWNSKNSNLPNNHNDHICMDQNGLIWLTVDEGLVTFNGKDFKNAEQNITDKGNFFGYYALATVNNNTKWVGTSKGIYSYDNTRWIAHDSSAIGFESVYKIVNNPRTNELFFCTDQGLMVLKEGQWTRYDKKNYKDLPSNRVNFAKRDANNRLWISTYDGSAMIDEKGNLTNFQKSNSVLNGKSITSMDEDDKGNLYFTLYEFDRKDKTQVNNDEGIAIRFADGTFKQFTTANSGMPFNHATDVVYDKKENVLWIATDRAGLVRYDLQDGWENYHNENSPVPTSYISRMLMDKQGNLYVATRQGVVKIQKKDGR